MKKKEKLRPEKGDELTVFYHNFFCIFAQMKLLGSERRIQNAKLVLYKSIKYPAVVAWFIKASVFHSVKSAPSANGGSNPV